MADTSKVGIDGWRAGTDATAQARVGVHGWYTVKAPAAPTLPTLSALARTNPRRPRYAWTP
jgi:hypothetical protein